jgi:hypothetical protein
MTRQCPKCGHCDTLQVFNDIFEPLAKAVGLGAAALLVWAIVRHITH